MPNRSTIHQISALHLIIEKTREFRKGRHLYIAFIDLKTAFDSVDHASLWAILACIGVPGKILRLFKKLYGDSQSCVRINGKISEWLNINSGVRQGCVAAPDLFNCVVDHRLLFGCPPLDPLVWICASHATAPSFSGYPGLRPDPGWFSWKRPRGAPRTRWIDMVRRDLDQLGLDPEAIEPLAQDRGEWRALVRLVGSTHDAPRGAVHETR